MNNKMVNGVVGGAVVEVDRRESESKGCGVFYPFGLAPPSVDTYVLWCVDRGRHTCKVLVARYEKYYLKQKSETSLISQIFIDFLFSGLGQKVKLLIQRDQE
jgi:hypothetical protein